MNKSTNISKLQISQLSNFNSCTQTNLHFICKIWLSFNGSSKLQTNINYNSIFFTTMATLYSSNSYLLTTTPLSKLAQRNTDPSHTLRFQKLSIWNSGSSSEDEGLSRKVPSIKFNPFEFNWKNINIGDVKSLIPVTASSPALSVSARQKDLGSVFVGGANGQMGVRIVLMLLRRGFRVRAGVSDLGDAQELARFGSDYKIISTDELKRLNAVESSIDDPESIAKAIGNASKVVVTIGSMENGPSNRVTTSDALVVVEAAQLAGVNHVVIIYDEPTLTGSTNNVLDGISNFFNNLFSRSNPMSVTQFLDRVIQMNVKYTFIRTSLADDFSSERSYNVVVEAEGSGGANDSKSNVPRSQLAALVADLLSNIEVAEDKVVEVYTDPTAPEKPLNELFSIIPEDGRRKAYTEAIAKAKAEEAAIKAAEQAREAEEAKKRLEEEVKRLSEQEAVAANLAKEAKQKAEEAGISIDDLLNKAKGISLEFSLEKLQSQLASSVKMPNIEVPKVQVATVRGQAKAQSLEPRKAVVKPSNQTPKKKTKPSRIESKDEGKPEGQGKEMRKILGGLFKQETIYVDDD